MSTIKIKSITDFCPMFQCEKTITVKYPIATDLNGNTFSQKGTYNCSDKINCTYEKCPIYLNAPQKD